MFSRFFNSAKIASTYKPVFLRALLDVGDLADEAKLDNVVGKEWLKLSSGRLFVNLNFVAVRFAKYYWDMEYSFKLKQSQDRQDANILKTIRKAHDPKKRPPTTKTLASDSMSGFRTAVIRRSIRPEVLVHLKRDMPYLYRKESPDEISFDARIVKYMNRNKILLRHGLNYMISGYLEKINLGIPNITQKVGHNADLIRRPQLCTNVVKRMYDWQESLCFYCKKPFEKRHVDHVIPFNFVFSTELYNCVLSCQRCNCKKSNTLPHKDQFDKVVTRNREKSDYMREQRIAYDEGSYCMLFKKCEIEYNDKKFFKPY